MGEDRGGPDGPGPGERAQGGGGAPPPRGRGRQGWWRGPALRQLVRAGRHRRLGRARAQAAVPAGRRRHRLHVVGASRRRGERYRPGGGAAGEGCIQHRRRRAGPGQPVAALPGRVRGREAADADPQVAGPTASRGNGCDHDDRGARLFPRQGQAGARLETALPLMGPGLQGRAGVTRTEEFEQLRPLLFAIAYRILGSVSDAEDALQETWLRYQASPAQPTSAKAFLSAVVTRISIDVLRSARVRREEYAGQWFPEPLLTDPYEDPERSAELADSLSMAALLLLERLSPLAREGLGPEEGIGVGLRGVR